MALDLQKTEADFLKRLGKKSAAHQSLFLDGIHATLTDLVVSYATRPNLAWDRELTSQWLEAHPRIPAKGFRMHKKYQEITDFIYELQDLRITCAKELSHVDGLNAIMRIFEETKRNIK
jgi:hypothetical protein